MVVAEKHAGGSAGASAVECVSNILGICDLKTINMYSTLAELGMDSMMAVEIKQSLEREFDIYLTPKEIRSLTFSRIMELSTINKEDEDNSKITESAEGEDMPEGMQLIIRTIGEEKMFLLDVIRLPSQTGSGTDFENISQTGPLMFMIPGIEGMASALESLAANLKYQTLCLQMGYRSNAQNVQDLVSRLLPEIENRLDNGAPFSLLGHSFGGLVALELAHILEAQGRKGQLFLIDSSPEFLSLVTKQALGFSNMEEVQIKLLCHILTLINPKEATVINMEKITQELTPIKNWKERIEHFSRMNFIPKDASTQHHKAVGNAMYMRVMSVIKYKWQHKNLIKSPVTLLRPTSLSAVHVKEDYGLSQYCEQKVNVHFLNGNHFTILDNIQTAKVINEAVPDIFKTGIFKDTIMAEHNTEMQSSAFAKGKQ